MFKYLHKKLSRIILPLILLITNNLSYSQCGNIDFYSPDTVVCTPFNAQFKISNLPPAATAIWNFGNGTLSGNPSPKRMYDIAGKYDVTLEIVVANKTICKITKKKYIDALPKPNIDIKWDKNVLCNGAEPISITDLTPNIVKRDYIVDGIYYQNASNIIQVVPDKNYGMKSINIFVTDNKGCKNSRIYDDAFVQYNSFNVLKRDIDYKPFNPVCSPVQLTFERIIPDLQNHTLKSFQWLVYSNTDSFTSKNSNPKFTLSEGVYSVNHKFTNQSGCTYEITKNKWITLYDSLTTIVKIKTSKPSACRNEPVTYTLNNKLSGEIEWVFEDGNPSSIISKTDSSITVTYNNPGTYGVTIRYINKKCVSYKRFKNLVTIMGPTPSLRLPFKFTCIVPRLATVTNTSDTTGVNHTTYRWEVKNDLRNKIVYSSTNFDSIQFHIIDTTSYSIKLVAIGDNGCIDSTNGKIIMDTLIPIVSLLPQPACPGQEIILEGLTPEGQDGYPSNHFIKIYDKYSDSSILDHVSGKVLFQDSLFADSGNITKFTLPDTGKYTLYIKAFNDLGCYGGEFHFDTIIVATPNINFLASDSLPCVGEEITLTSLFPYKEFRTYRTNWFIEHTDTNIVFTSRQNPDTQNFVFNIPGIYKARFAYSAPQDLCIDTVDAPFRIKVSGISLKLTSTEQLKGCEPLDINWHAKIIKNFNFRNNIPNKYYWRSEVDSTLSSTYVPPEGISTKATYYDKGTYQTSVLVEHGAGEYCNDSFYSPKFIVGAVSVFSFDHKIRCLNKKYQLKNSSTNSVKYKWISNPPNAVSFYPNDTVKEPAFIPIALGDFSISLVAIGTEGCTDTSTKEIQVIDPKAYFTSDDTLHYCAPANSILIPDYNEYASLYTWYFGDGDSLINDKANAISHVYRNNTDLVGLDVSLTITTPGCKDTMTREGYMKIIGPMPKYSFSINNGCEPLVIDFKNESKNYLSFLFDYGDGSTIDSTEIGDHKYYVMDKRLRQQCFKTQLSLVDGNGCHVSYTFPQDVCVKKMPEPDFENSDTVGCEILTTKFNNTSQYTDSFRWDFEGNGSYVCPIDSNPQYSYKAGVYSPVLVSINYNGCTDTTNIGKMHIHSQPLPVANFKAQQDTICYNSPLQFNSLSKSDSKIIFYEWNFGDSSDIHKISNDANPIHSYKSTLDRNIQLIVTDSNYCVDTISKSIFVIDTLPPLNLGLHYVTTTDNKDVSIFWKSSDLGFFGKYFLLNVEEDSTLFDLYESNNRNDTTFRVSKGVDIFSKRYCYTTAIGDTCGTISAYSPKHCTILTKVSKHSHGKLQIDWSEYIGWSTDSIWGYILHRSKDGSDFISIDTLDNLTTSYLDSNLCEVDYCYYIEAVNLNDAWRSLSNIDCETPDYIYPKIPIVARRASVEDDRDIIIEWEEYTKMSVFSRYMICKENKEDGIHIDFYDSTKDLFYIDNDVDVMNQSYSYYISPKDICDYIAPKSNVSKSILLKSKVNGYQIDASWSPYEFWDNGIEKYVIERKTIFDDYEYSGEVSGNLTSYSFTDLRVEENRKVCLRVYAVRNGQKDTSYSNSTCEIPDAQIYIPNAFSPNDDGINDIFKPSGIYIKNDQINGFSYHMQIFDSWGNQVFYSNDLYKGWDGTSQNKPCKMGVYLYTIKASSLDGENDYFFKGTVHLIR